MAKNHTKTVSKHSKKYKNRRFLNVKFIVCCYCGRHLDREHSTTEHIVPLAKNGKKLGDNLDICCKSCNCDHSKILSSDINNERNLVKIKNPKAKTVANKDLSNRKYFWKLTTLDSVIEYMLDLDFFENKNVDFYKQAAYYYCGYKTLNSLNLNQEDRKLVFDRFYDFP